MAVSKVKLRMLYIMKILFEKSDERHALSANDINRLLQNYGMLQIARRFIVILILYR